MASRRKITPRRRAAPARGDRRARGRSGAGGSRRSVRRTFPVVAVALTTFVVLAAGVALYLYTHVAHAGPTRPAALDATSTSPTSVTLTWRGDADKYVVQVGSDRALTKDTRTITSTREKATLTGLTGSVPAADRYVRVVAYKDGKKASSRTAAFELAPGTVGALHVAKVSAVGAKVTWEQVSNVDQYDVQVAADSAFSKSVSTVRTVGHAASFTTESLKPSHTYYVRVRPVNGSTDGTFSRAAKVRTHPESVSFNLATWNVCSEKCSGYAGRARIGAQFINDNKADVFGLQEAGGEKVGAVTKAIWSGHSQGYKVAAGGAEARYIFYRPTVFTQLAGGHFYVGDTRNLTWAIFEAKASKTKFVYADVHIENGHGNDAKRRRETQRILAQMKIINKDDLPIVYAGDFNSGIHRPQDSPGDLMRAAGMKDTRYEVDDPVNAQYNSGHTFSTSIPTSGDYVDHVFVSRGFSVLGWKQLVRITNGRYTKPIVSDHNALLVRLSLGVPSEDVGTATPTVVTPR